MSRFVLTAQLQLQAPSNVGQVVKQIQNQLKGINVNVNVKNSSQATRQIKDLSDGLEGASKASNTFAKNFGSAIRRVSASAIAYKAVGLFTSTLSKAVEESIAFEKELIKISQVTGKTIENLQFLTSSITNLSAGLGVSSSALLQASRTLSQAGFSAKDAEIALGTLARTDLAPTFDNITQTAEGAIAIFNQFKLGAAALEQQLGAINAVAGQFAVESGDLISVVRRTGGVFKAAGGELNELIALFTSVRSTTRESSESIATGLRTIFTRIQRPRTIEYMKKFGVELTDLEGKFVGPYEAVRRLSEALAGLDEGDITFVQIAEELGGFRQIGKVIPLLRQFSTAQKALAVAQDGGASLAKDAATAQLSLANQIAKVREEFLALIRGVTETTTFKVMATAALNLASSLIKVADALKPILPIITAIAAVRLTKSLAGFVGGIAGSLRGGKGFSTGGKVHKFATGGTVPGTGNRDTVPAMLTPGEFVIRKSSASKIGAQNLKRMNEGGKADLLVKKGTQVGGVGIFDSDMIGAGSKELLGKLKSSGKQYEVIHGPAGSGKTTFATKRFGNNFIRSEEDLDKYSKFVVLSGAGKVKAGGLSPDASSLFSGATKITGLSPSPETVLQRREQRLATGSIDRRSEKALRGTLKAPTTFDQDLYKGFNNVEILEKFADGGKAQEKSEKNFGKIGFRSTVGGNLTATYLGNKGRTGMVSANYNNGIYTVGLSKATSGYGPMLYDVVMELATSLGSMLAPDRNQVSKDAQGVWSYYFNKRNDVTKHPLDPSQWTKNQSLIDPKLYGKKETWPPKTDPAWILQSGYKKPQRITTDPSRAINLNDPKYADFIRQSQMSYMQPAQKKNLGGIIQKFKDGSTGTGVAPVRNRMGMTPEQVAAAEERKRLREQAKTGAGGTLQLKSGIVGGLFLQEGSGGKSGINKSLQGVELPGFAEGSKTLKASIYTGQLKPEAGQSIRNELKPNITQAVQNAAASSMAALEISPLDIDEKSAAKRAVNKIDLTSIEGYIFEAFTSALTGLQLSDTGATFDYVNPSGRARQRVGQLFSSGLSGERLLDAKRTLSTDSVQSGKSSIANKIVAGIRGGLLGPQDFEKFATGGIVPGVGNRDTVPATLQAGDFVIRKRSVNSIGAGNLQKMAGYNSGGKTTDVPALLTPGEFVFSKPQAKKIGYGKLNRMNKAGKYASGGVVGGFRSGGIIQKFKGGGEAKGVGGFSLNEAAIGLLAFQGALQQLTPTIDENSTSFEKMTAGLIGTIGNLVNTFTVVQASLAAFGVSLNVKNVTDFLKGFDINKLGDIKKMFGSGKGGLGDMIGGFQRRTGVGGKVTSIRRKGEGLIESFNKEEGVRSARSKRASELLKARADRKNSPIQLGNSRDWLDDLKQQTKGLNLSKTSPKKTLTGKLGQFISKKSAQGGIGGGIAKLAGGGIQKLGGSAIFKTLTTAIGPLVGGFTALLGPVTAATAIVSGLNGILGSFYDNTEKLNKAIEEGNVAEAEKLAGGQVGLENANNARMVGGGAGAAIGMVLGGPIGAAIGGAIGTGVATLFANTDAGQYIIESISTAFGGKTTSSVVALAGANAAAARATKDLEKASKTASTAMDDFKNGSISAFDALTKIEAATSSTRLATSKATTAITENSKNKSTGALSYGRELMSYLSFGYVDDAKTRNKAIDAENKPLMEKAMQNEAQRFDMSKQARLATGRSVFAMGGSMEMAREKTGVGEMRKKSLDLNKQATQMELAGDEEGGKMLRQMAQQFEEQALEMEHSLENLQKEVEKARKAFAAMNLGLNSVQGAANAFSDAMTNYAASQEAGNVSVMRNFATLEAGITSAATAMDPAALERSLKGMSETMRSFGADEAQITQFENNLKAVNKTQANAEAGLKAFQDQLAKDLERGVVAGGGGEAQFDQLFNTIMGSVDGLDDVTKGRLEDMLKGMEGKIDYGQIADGNFSQIQEVFKQLGVETLKQVEDIAKAEQLYQETIRDAAKKRATAESSLIDASRQKSDYEKESRQIIQEAGGPAFTAQQQRKMAVDRYNAGVQQGQLPLSGASAADISKQQQALQKRQAEIGAIRTRAAGANDDQVAIASRKQLEGESGVKLEQEESNLVKQNQELYNTTKTLIDIKKQELNIIKEKNKLEKQSMESLLSGDIEGFFDAQSTQSAIGAVAAGNFGDFDADTLNKAFQELKRQAEAGVQEIGGQSLEGPGGLIEKAAMATAQARGLDPAQAAMVAQGAVGQTPAEQSINNEIQQLASTLPQFGDMAINMAQQQMQAADLQIQAANLQKEAAVAKAKENKEKALPAPPQPPPNAAGISTGGLIYAARGRLVNFVPKGTDTVPAMLTPGEFVVNRAAVQRGNNLSILKAMNQGSRVASSAPAAMKNGGVVYRATGSSKPEVSSADGGIGGFDTNAMNQFANALNKFNDTILQSINTLQNTQFTIKLEPTTVNINLTGTSFLQTLTNDLQNKLMGVISQQLKGLRVDNLGRVVQSSSEV